MMSGKCKCGRICPVSLGLALGITCVLSMVFMVVVVMLGLASPEMAVLKTDMTWSVALMHLLRALIGGFVFGFVLALIYDCCVSCMAKCCSKSNGGACGCGPSEKK
jgi:hypothetical protein